MLNFLAFNNPVLTTPERYASRLSETKTVRHMLQGSGLCKYLCILMPIHSHEMEDCLFRTPFLQSSLQILGESSSSSSSDSGLSWKSVSNTTSHGPISTFSYPSLWNCGNSSCSSMVHVRDHITSASSVNSPHLTRPHTLSGDIPHGRF